MLITIETNASMRSVRTLKIERRGHRIDAYDIGTGTKISFSKPRETKTRVALLGHNSCVSQDTITNLIPYLERYLGLVIINWYPAETDTDSFTD